MTPATMLAVIALVLAVAGGAFAATGGHGLSGEATASLAKKKTAVSTGKPGPRGPAGPAGPQGSAGLQGPVGVRGETGATGAEGKEGKEGRQGEEGHGRNGAQGEKGPQGEKGANGAPGADGKGVEVAEFSGEQEGHCKGGGSSFKVEGSAAKVYACNGEQGSGGGGLPETLPPGKSESGTWSASVEAPKGAAFEDTVGAISFPIPLAQPPTAVYYFTEAQTRKQEFGSSGCEGNANEPRAPAGTLCVFTGGIEESEWKGVKFVAISTPGGNTGLAGTIGARVEFAPEELEPELKAPIDFSAFGGWAVTAAA